jgi:hypothetical protein
MKLTKINPVREDGMPPQVAREFLINPRAKITNTFRKTCLRARENVYPSENISFRTSPDEVGYFINDEHETIDPAVRLDRKLRRLSLRQLGRRRVQAAKRRTSVQHSRIKLNAKIAQLDSMPPFVAAMHKQLDAHEAAHNHAIESITAEINRRNEVCRTDRNTPATS